MLADADEEDGHVGGVDDADERAHHVAHRVTLGDDEAVESAAWPERRIEVACLRH